ncbi:hypothetical protein BOX15_Mlig026680g3, partial [Macrostomum lignano]
STQKATEMPKSRRSSKDKQDGGCVSVPSLTVDLAEDPVCQGAVAWLQKSESALLFDIAERLLQNQEFDMDAVRSQMPSPLHWVIVKRHIDLVKERACPSDGADPEASSPQLNQEPLADDLGRMNSLRIDAKSLEPSKSLQEFSLPDDPLGHAFVGDFSEKDMEQLRTLAHIELAVQFEKAGHRPAFRYTAPLTPAPASPLPPPSPTFGWRRHKSPSSKSRNGGSSWFGVSLESMLEAERKLRLPETQVPHLVSSLINRLQSCGLNEEGIFRVSGSVAAIRELRSQIETDGPNAPKIAKADPHDAAGLLKGFLRDLPTPLMSGPYVEYYRCLDQLPTMHQRLIGVNLLVMLLPSVACHTLKAVVDLLGSVLDHHNENLMSLRALATVMTPSLLPEELTSTLGDSERSAAIVELLINYRQFAWRVPATLVRHLRSNKCFFHGLDRLNEPVEEIQQPDPDEESISLTLPDGSCQNISLPRELTAWDLLHRRCGSGNNPDDFNLYEIGGNIKERRLPANTQLRQLLAVNPKMSLLIRHA